MGIISKDSNSYEVYVGVDIGQAHDPTAIVVVDPEVRDREIHYPVRFLKRLPLGLSYPLIIEEIKRIYNNIPQPESERRDKQDKISLDKHMWIDATGVGKPVVDLIEKEISELHYSRLHAVFLTGSEAKERVNVHNGEIKLPKAYLVSRLQVLISCGRVHLPKNTESQA